MKCTKCGNELKDGVKFCSQCGEAVKEVCNMKCRKCGKKLNENVKFCSACGTKVEYDSGEKSKGDVESSPEPKSVIPKKWVIPTVIVAGIAIIVIVAFLGVKAMRKPEKVSESETVKGSVEDEKVKSKDNSNKNDISNEESSDDVSDESPITEVDELESVRNMGCVSAKELAERSEPFFKAFVTYRAKAGVYPDSVSDIMGVTTSGNSHVASNYDESKFHFGEISEGISKGIGIGSEGGKIKYTLSVYPISNNFLDTYYYDYTEGRAENLKVLVKISINSTVEHDSSRGGNNDVLAILEYARIGGDWDIVGMSTPKNEFAYYYTSASTTTLNYDAYADARNIATVLSTNIKDTLSKVTDSDDKSYHDFYKQLYLVNKMENEENNQVVEYKFSYGYIVNDISPQFIIWNIDSPNFSWGIIYQYNGIKLDKWIVHCSSPSDFYYGVLDLNAHCVSVEYDDGKSYYCEYDFVQDRAYHDVLRKSVLVSDYDDSSIQEVKTYQNPQRFVTKEEAQSVVDEWDLTKTCPAYDTLDEAFANIYIR